MADELIQAEVVYCGSSGNALQRVTLRAGASIEEAIKRSRFLERFPDIDLGKNKVGIYGVQKRLETPVQAEDRIEIYRPITADPETVPRRDLDEVPASQKGE